MSNLFSPLIDYRANSSLSSVSISFVLLSNNHCCPNNVLAIHDNKTGLLGSSNIDVFKASCSVISGSSLVEGSTLWPTVPPSFDFFKKISSIKANVSNGATLPVKKTHTHTETQLKLRSPLSTENQIPPHWKVKPPSKKRFQEKYLSQKREKDGGNSTKRLYFCIQNLARKKKQFLTCVIYEFMTCVMTCVIKNCLILLRNFIKKPVE